MSRICTFLWAESDAVVGASVASVSGPVVVGAVVSITASSIRAVDDWASVVWVDLNTSVEAIDKADVIEVHAAPATEGELSQRGRVTVEGDSSLPVISNTAVECLTSVEVATAWGVDISTPTTVVVDVEVTGRGGEDAEGKDDAGNDGSGHVCLFVMNINYDLDYKTSLSRPFIMMGFLVEIGPNKYSMVYLEFIISVI